MLFLICVHKFEFLTKAIIILYSVKKSKYLKLINTKGRYVDVGRKVYISFIYQLIMRIQYSYIFFNLCEMSSC